MGSIETRLAVLEQLLPQGCAICRDWVTAPLAIVLRGDEHRIGSERPDQCPACGRLVPAEDIRIVFGQRADGPQ